MKNLEGFYPYDFITTICFYMTNHNVEIEIEKDIVMEQREYMDGWLLAAQYLAEQAGYNVGSGKAKWNADVFLKGYPELALSFQDGRERGEAEIIGASRVCIH